MINFTATSILIPQCPKINLCRFFALCTDGCFKICILKMHFGSPTMFSGQTCFTDFTVLQEGSQKRWKRTSLIAQLLPVHYQYLQVIPTVSCPDPPGRPGGEKQERERPLLLTCIKEWGGRLFFSWEMHLKPQSALWWGWEGGFVQGRLKAEKERVVMLALVAQVGLPTSQWSLEISLSPPFLQVPLFDMALPL